MTQLDVHNSGRVYRGTWAQILAHSNEIPQASEVELKVLGPMPVTDADPTIALLQSWLEEDATDDPDELRQAEEELREFQRNMNQPRKEVGARLLYPEAE